MDFYYGYGLYGIKNGWCLIGYSCWAINIKEEGKPELDKSWIDGINRLMK